MTRGRAALLVMLAGTAAAWVVHAQTPTPQQRPPVFRSDANFVQVDAYPVKDGRIVTNLEKADFEILEDGKPQAIEAFELIKVEPFTPDAERRDPNTQEEGNALVADARNRAFVVYLDVPHVSVEGAHATRKPLVQMLDRIMAPNDLFGVMTPDMRPRDLVFGRKVMTAEDMLTRHWPWGERDAPRTAAEDALDACTIDSRRREQNLVEEGAAVRRMIDVLIDRQREDRVLTNLENLIEYLSGLRETRMSLVIFTEGWMLYEPDEALVNGLGEKAGDLPAVGIAGGRLRLDSGAEMGTRAG
ncbi:MAG: hypothetical protein KA205_02005, partial [Acidobacteria bacterium]|nr:hypothetical protein [Acidobacteriota bacterium]